MYANIADTKNSASGPMEIADFFDGAISPMGREVSALRSNRGERKYNMGVEAGKGAARTERAGFALPSRLRMSSYIRNGLRSKRGMFRAKATLDIMDGVVA